MARQSRNEEIAAGLMRETFKSIFEDDQEGNGLISRELELEYEPSVRPIRFRAVELIMSSGAFTAAYRGFTPKKKLFRESAAIRLPKDSNALRVLPLSSSEKDMTLFARGYPEGENLNDRENKLWIPVLRELIRKAGQ